MSDTSRVIRKFERRMGTSNITEVRGDTKGALFDEVQRSMELQQQNRIEPKIESKNEKKARIIGHFVYDFNKGTEKFIYTPKYKLIRFMNQSLSTIQNYFSKN